MAATKEEGVTHNGNVSTDIESIDNPLEAKDLMISYSHADKDIMVKIRGTVNIVGFVANLVEIT